MFAGHYNNKTCYGDTIEKFKIIAEETSKFLETAEANYDVAVTNAKVSGSDRILTKREVEAKKFLLHAKMQKCLMLKEIYKKYGVDLYDDDSAFAFLFFLIAIKEQERRKLAAKRHVYYLEQKAKRALYKIQCIKELTVDDSSENEFNLNNTSFSSCIPNTSIYPVKRKIAKSDKEFVEFEEVFSGSRFYINKKTKKLWLLADEVLIPVQAEDYIKKGE